MPLVPHRFLLRLAHPCPFVKKMPLPDSDRLLDLPPDCRIDNYAGMDDRRNFADVFLAWNELGLGLQVEVRGKANRAAGRRRQAARLGRDHALARHTRLAHEPPRQPPLSPISFPRGGGRHRAQRTRFRSV